MKQLTLIIPVLLVITLVSCGKQDRELKAINKEMAEVDSIVKMNQVLTVEQRMRTGELVERIDDYADDHEEDTLSAQLLFHAAILCDKMPDYKKELKLLDKLVKKFPESRLAPQALATAARVSEAGRQDLNVARSYLIQIKEKYPNSPYALNIDLQIEYVGDDEGLLNAIMEKNGTSLESVLHPGDSVDTVKK